MANEINNDLIAELERIKEVVSLENTAGYGREIFICNTVRAPHYEAVTAMVKERIGTSPTVLCYLIDLKEFAPGTVTSRTANNYRISMIDSMIAQVKGA